MRPPRTRLWAEAPWLVCGLLACLWLSLRSQAWVSGTGPDGYGWPGYLRHAWAVANGETGRWDPFREPLWGALVGHLGEALGSLPDGAMWVSSMSTMVLVLATAALGRALAGPWAGAAAALGMPLMRALQLAPVEMNVYPYLAACSALALAAGVVFARWPGLGSAMGLGLGTALALTADTRAGLLVPALALLGLLGLWRSRRWLHAPALLTPLGLVPAVPWFLGATGQNALSLADMRAHQVHVVQRFVGMVRDSELPQACPESTAWLSAEVLLSPCAQAMVSHNLWVLLPPHAPAGVVMGGLAVALWWIPGRSQRRAWLPGILLACGVGMPLLVYLAWTPFPDRYMLQLAPLLHVLLPVGLARVADRLPLGGWARHLAGGLAACMSLGWVGLHDPATRTAPLSQEQGDKRMLERSAWALVHERLPLDAVFMDCAGQRVNDSLLPRRTWAQAGEVPVGAKECVGLLSGDIPSGHWLLTMPTRGGPFQDFDAQVGADPDWQLVHSEDRLRLWRRGP